MIQRTYILLVIFCALLLPAPLPAYTPTRIISLKPNITEILFALGVGDKVVGITTWCDYPSEATKLPKVADYININTEKIIALRPDLVIGSEENSIKEPFKVLENAGIKTLLVPFRTMEDLYSSIEKIAKTVGETQKGNELINKMKTGLLTKTPTHQNINILILVGHHPLVAAGPGTFLGEIIKLIGAKNIISGSSPYPTINTEFIIAKNPDVIIDLGMGSDAAGELPEILRKKVAKLDMSEFRAGPRIGMAVKKLKEKL